MTGEIPREKPPFLSRFQCKSRFRAIAVSFLLLVSACGGEKQEKDRQTASRLEVESPMPPVADKPALTEITGVTQETRDTYQWYCAQCHGLKGKGDGINAAFLTVPPRDHTKADYLETRTDEQLFNAIKLGGVAVGRAPCMPAWRHTLDEQAMRSLVNYIRELCQCEAF